MRRVIYSVATSLDGYIAGPNGEFDWIPRDPAVDWGAFMGRFDTVLMGRRTFEVSARQGSGNLPNMRTFVFSRTLKASEHPNVTLVAEDAGQLGQTGQVLRTLLQTAQHQLIKPMVVQGQHRIAVDVDRQKLAPGLA
jgi:dihydrofolate reductase